jgi:hypothetical protein
MKTVMVKCRASGSTKYKPLRAAARQATTIVGICPIKLPQKQQNITVMEIIRLEIAFVKIEGFC